MAVWFLGSSTTMPSTSKWTALNPPHEQKFRPLKNDEADSSRETSPEIPLAKKLFPKKRRIGSLVREMDSKPRSLKGYGYPDTAYLLADKVFVGATAIYCPTQCYRCEKYRHVCSGEQGKRCGRCIRDRQKCISPEQYKKEAAAKAAANAAVKMEQTTKTAQAKAGSSKAVAPNLPKEIIGKRTCREDTEATVEELADRADETMRELHARIAELGSLQAALMKRFRA